jgi:carboxyl-terminal processing protease
VQAWRAVDRAYVDKSFNGQSWFRVRERFLKEESMTERQETYAAIRKMLALLDDPFTRFLEPNQYALLQRGATGSVTGVGLEVAFSQRPESLGQLLVRAPKNAGLI